MRGCLVQYIVVNEKILTLGWSKGAVIAQACHAAIAVMSKYKDDPNVQEYTNPDSIKAMTKVVLKADEATFNRLILQLEESRIDHWAWHEKPDEIISAVALKPYLREEVFDLVKHIQLYR